MVRKNTWVILGIFAALSVVVIVLQNLPAKETVPDPLQLTPVPVVVSYPLFEDATAITQILELRVTTEAGGAFHLLQDNEGAWGLLAPEVKSADELDAMQIEFILMQLISIYSSAMNEPVEDLALVGLDNPQASLQLTLSDGKTVTLYVGDQTPLQDGYFAQVDQNEIVVLDSYIIEAMLSLIDFPPVLIPTPES